MTDSDSDAPSEREEQLRRINEVFCTMIPHNSALGLAVVDFSFDGVAVLRLPWAQHLVGNPDTGVLHGGAITALIDSACGASVFLKLASPLPVATLDLRIDYLRPAEPGREVHARAECYKVSRNVAFARGLAYHDDAADPIASASATFMIKTAGSTLVPPLGSGEGAGPGADGGGPGAGQ